MYSQKLLEIDLHDAERADLHLAADLDSSYFAAMGDEIDHGQASVEAVARRVSEDVYQLDCRISGELTVACDRCLDDMQLPFSTTSRLIIKATDRDADEAEDDTMAVDKTSRVADLSWYIYETIAMALPLQHVHEPGKCNSAMTALLERHSAARSGEEQEAGAGTPLRDKLEKLKATLKE